MTANPIDVIARGTGIPFIIGSSGDETSRQAPASFPPPPIPDEPSYLSAVEQVFGTGKRDAIVAQYPVAAFATPLGAFIAATTDGLHVCPSRRIARAGVAGGNTVYRYFFTHALQNSPLNASGAFHALDTLLLFKLGSYRPSATPSEIALADATAGYWTRFSATGTPDGPGAVTWPVYDAATDPFLQLDDTIVAGAGIRTTNCDFWDSIE